MEPETLPLAWLIVEHYDPGEYEVCAAMAAHYLAWVYSLPECDEPVL